MFHDIASLYSLKLDISGENNFPLALKIARCIEIYLNMANK